MAKIRVFLSWSGSISEYVAKEFRNRMKHLLKDDVDPFFSKDIAGGARGIHVIEQALREANHSLLFLTRQNRGKEWIPFEAGAVSKELNESFVCPILIGFPHEELSEPLSLFQTKQITDELGILGVFDAVCKTVRGPDRGINPTERSDLKTWIANLNQEISRHLLITLENNPHWARTTLGRVSGDTQSSPFQATDALRVAKRRVVFVGQNLYTLSKPNIWDSIRRFLLGERHHEHGAAASERSVNLLFMAPDDPDKEKAKQVDILVTAWAYTNNSNPEGFRNNLRDSIFVWNDRQKEAYRDGFADRIQIRLATTFIPLSQTFVDPGLADGSGKLFLRPFYRGPESAKRPVILLTEKNNGEAFRFYLGIYDFLWGNDEETRPL